MSKKKLFIFLAVIALGAVMFFSQQLFDRNQSPTSTQQQINNKSKETEKRSTGKLAEVEKAESKKAEEELKKSLEMARLDGSSGGASIQEIFNEYWLEVLGLVISLVGLFLAVSGFSFAGKKKQKFMQKYLHMIDEVYGNFKMKSETCEAELFRIQNEIEQQLKAGVIDESAYDFLQKRIDKYKQEVKIGGVF